MATEPIRLLLQTTLLAIWDTRMGCPCFVDEPPGDGAGHTAEGSADTRRYALNIARWLSADIGDRRC